MNKSALKKYLSSTTETYTGYRTASRITSVGVVAAAGVVKEASVGTKVTAANAAADSVGLLAASNAVMVTSVGTLVTSLNAALDSVGTKAGSTISSAALANALTSIQSKITVIDGQVSA
jgi:hypothetical protein